MGANELLLRGACLAGTRKRIEFLGNFSLVGPVACLIPTQVWHAISDVKEIVRAYASRHVDDLIDTITMSKQELT